MEITGDVLLVEDWPIEIELEGSKVTPNEITY
jgi:hypothetical protein